MLKERIKNTIKKKRTTIMTMIIKKANTVRRVSTTIRKWKSTPIRTIRTMTTRRGKRAMMIKSLTRKENSIIKKEKPVTTPKDIRQKKKTQTEFEGHVLLIFNR